MIESARLAFRTLRGHLFRTFLTMLSVTIGAFSIVVMLSLAQSGQGTLSKAVEEIGGMRLVLWIPPDDASTVTAHDKAVYDRGFTQEDLERLAEVPYLEKVTSESQYGSDRVYAQANNPLKADVVGMREGLLDVLSWKLAAGRAIDDQDNVEKQRVAVLTEQLARSLFPDWDLGATVGQTVFVRQKPYVVVGVLEKRDMMGVQFGFSWETTVFIPQITAEKRDGWPEGAKFFVGLTSDPAKNDTVTALANKALLVNHRGVEDFQSLDFSGFLEKFYSFFRILDAIVALIAGISLFAGGIGVMNIMLVSVSERVREIGIRRSVGASQRDILSQFLFEACTLSFTGGLVGVGLGLGVVSIVNPIIRHFLESWMGMFSVVGVALALGVTGAIGLLFGVVPAWRASRFDIVECLRSVR
jgi:putative ABC transport system permease protein